MSRIIVLAVSACLTLLASVVGGKSDSGLIDKPQRSEESVRFVVRS